MNMEQNSTEWARDDVLFNLHIYAEQLCAEVTGIEHQIRGAILHCGSKRMTRRQDNFEIY